jgi:hypothetical protein
VPRDERGELGRFHVVFALLRSRRVHGAAAPIFQIIRLCDLGLTAIDVVDEKFGYVSLAVGYERQFAVKYATRQPPGISGKGNI